jgi:hypothetical protein
VLKKLFFIIKNLKCKKIKISYNLKLFSFKNETLNLQKIKTLSKIDIYFKMMKKKKFMYLDNYKHL